MKRRSYIMLLILVVSLMVGSVFAVQEGSIRVQMYNANLAAKINTIYPWYRITNTGSTPVNLADIKIRYFYTIDGEKPQIFKCDWSSIGSTNVTGAFAKLDNPSATSDYYFELGFKTSAGFLQPGKSIDVQSRFYKSDWSNYTQTNDYSFNPKAQQYVDWDKIAVQVGQGAIEDFVTSSDFTKDNQWIWDAVTIHLSVTGKGSETATTYYTVNDGETINGKAITLNADGIYKVRFWSKGRTSYTETSHIVTVKIDRTGPVVTGSVEPSPNANGWLKGDATVSFTATDALSGVASVSPAVTVATEGGNQTVPGEARDHVGNISSTIMTLNIDKTPPIFSTLYPNTGSVINQTCPTISAEILENLSGIDTATVSVMLDGKAVHASVENGQVRYTPTTPLSTGQHTFKINGSDQAGNPAAELSSTFTIDPTLPTLPPDPATVAPQLDTTVCTSMVDATKFLYTGENPIQTGVAEGTIEAKRAAVLRGRVLDKDGQPLPGVKITVLNHPEYGQTYSRADGMFDLAVNGGGYLTVKYERTGYLGAQRQVDTPWQDYVWLPEVWLVQKDEQVTEVALNSTEAQMVKGSVSTDADGSRQATLIIPSGTKINGYNGSSINIRATEFTVGANGPKKMPASLPANVAYTYCIDLSADEEEGVQFSQPIYFYVENFLNFPVGGNVPVGYYDESKGVWIPSDNGLIIRILSVNNGLAEIDVSGTGQAADATTLAGLGFTDAERQRLGNAYQTGQSLWRVPIKHFSYWDCNWGWGPPNGATGPNGGTPNGNSHCPDGHHCYIERENQILRETTAIVGTPFTLNYSSDRVPGRISNRTLQIPLSGNSVPPTLKRIDLEVDIEGQQYQKSFDNSPNQLIRYTWNGKDGYGRTVFGVKKATINVGYVYNGTYENVQKFAGPTDGSQISGDRDAFEITIWQTYIIDLEQSPSQARDMSGWSLNIHHFYDAKGNTLYLGTGDKQKVERIQLGITTLAGTDSFGFEGDGGPAIQAKLDEPRIAVGPDGSIYIADFGNSRIRQIGPDGIITTIAGTGSGNYGEVNGPATSADIVCRGVALGHDGSIYFTDGAFRVYRLGLDGMVSTLAGRLWYYGYNGDGIPASQAVLGTPVELAVGPDDSLYIAEPDIRMIRKIGPDGIINIVAGTLGTRYSDDGVPAIKAELDPRHIAFGPDGSLYFYENYRIRKIGPDGIIKTIAGGEGIRYDDDGIPASQADIYSVKGLCVGPDGSIYFSENNRIRRIGPDGIINTIVGGKDGEVGYSEDGCPALQAKLNNVGTIALGPDGSLFFCEGNRIRALPASLINVSDGTIAVPSEDGNEIYRFDRYGRHLDTLNALTKVVTYKFGYDKDGNLASVTDMDGNVTTIVRSSSQTVITASYGQRTTLINNGEGYLQTIINPAGEANNYTYKVGGLLDSITYPKGQKYEFTYDDLGRATQELDPNGGKLILERSENDLSYQVKVTELKDSTHTYIKTFSVETLTTGETRMVTTEGSNITEETIIGADRSCKKLIAPDGTTTTITYTGDPRFGMSSPVMMSQIISLPSGLNYKMTGNRRVKFNNPADISSVSQLIDIITVNDKTAISTYDVANHTVTSTSPMGRQTVTTLDEKGRVVKVEVPGLVPVTFEYDVKGRLFKTTQGSGSEARISSIVYNADGWVESVTDPLLQKTSFEYDAVGRVKKQTLPDSRVIQFNYDSNGNMTTLTPSGKPEHGFSYNSVNMTDKYTPPTVTNGGETSYEYNLAKQPTLVTRPDGKTISFEYDTMGRLVTLTLPDGEIAYTYDTTTGQLKNVIGRDGGALTYGYDGSLPTDVNWNGTIKGKVGVTYNNDFAVVTQSVNDGQTVSYAYDNDGLLTSVGDLTATYDPQNGAIQGTTIGNVTDSYGYTPFGEVKDYTASVSGVGVYASSFTYDKLGRISTKTETVNGETHTYQYGYDSIGQLTDVWVDGSLKSHYDYDSNGNRVGGTYDDQDRMIKYGENTYQYSANGELQEKVTPTGTTKYEYDVLGNLTAVTLEDGTKIEYLIDGANRRVGKKVNGVLVQGWLYQDGLKPIAELDGNGNVVGWFVYGTSDVIPEYFIKNGTKYRIIRDHLGSPRMIVVAETGQIVEQIDYDEFGNVKADTNPGFTPFGFAGGLYDRDTKLTRFGARDYDAEIGRWTCKDPIGFKGADTELYGYVGNNPISYIDTTGLKTRSINISASIYVFVGVQGSVGFVWDDKGNWGFKYSGGGGSGVEVGLGEHGSSGSKGKRNKGKKGFGIGPIDYSWDDTCDIYGLNGWSEENSQTALFFNMDDKFNVTGVTLEPALGHHNSRVYTGVAPMSDYANYYKNAFYNFFSGESLRSQIETGYGF